MPVYELACQDCGHQFEFFKAQTTETASCPKCGAGEEKLEKQVVASSFLLKGPGWFRDRYRGSDE